MQALVIDVETTGLILNPARRLEFQPEIISFASALVDLASAEIFNEYYKIFKPTKLISQEITNITGFTNSILANASSIEFYLDEIINILEAAPVIVGMNVQFDKNMVELECRRYNKEIKWPTFIDLIAQSIYIKGYRLSLTNLSIELFGKEFDKAHRADIDVQVTVRCAIEMWKKGML